MGKLYELWVNPSDTDTGSALFDFEVMIVAEQITIWDSIRTAITDTMRGNDLMTAVKARELRPYNILTLDLGTAHSATDTQQFMFEGNSVSVLKLDGSATITFNEKDNDAVDLTLLKRIETPFYRFYITNTAQSSKTLVLAIGRVSAFTAWITT